MAQQAMTINIWVEIPLTDDGLIDAEKLRSEEFSRHLATRLCEKIAAEDVMAKERSSTARAEFYSMVLGEPYTPKSATPSE